MPNNKGKGPHPMDRKVVKRLLDALTTDDAFREKFSTDATSALESIGYVAPADSLHSGGCLQLKAGATLASPEEITAARGSLEESLSAIQDFVCPTDLQR